jgi:hypothetical protein
MISLARWARLVTTYFGSSRANGPGRFSFAIAPNRI